MIQTICTHKGLPKSVVALRTLVESFVSYAARLPRWGRCAVLAGRGGLVVHIVSLSAHGASGHIVRVPVGMITGVNNG